MTDMKHYFESYFFTFLNLKKRIEIDTFSEDEKSVFEDLEKNIKKNGFFLLGNDMFHFNSEIKLIDIQKEKKINEETLIFRYQNAYFPKSELNVKENLKSYEKLILKRDFRLNVLTKAFEGCLFEIEKTKFQKYLLLHERIDFCNYCHNYDCIYCKKFYFTFKEIFIISPLILDDFELEHFRLKIKEIQMELNNKKIFEFIEISQNENDLLGITRTPRRNGGRTYKNKYKTKTP
jgi:hypothetical protein